MNFFTLELIEFYTISFCILASAFFSASETAITSLGSLKAKHMLDQMDYPIKSLELWLKYPNRVLTTILIFNNVVNILASALATDLATSYFESQAIGIATGIMTFLILIFGEVIPKSFAKAHHERLATFFMKVIYVVYIGSYPVVVALSWFAATVLKTFGSTPPDTPPITEEELEFLVNVGQRAGVIEESKKEMLVGVFDIDEIKVREIMTPRPDIEFISLDDTIDDALSKAIETGFSRLPIAHSEDGIDHVVGILLVKDLLIYAKTSEDTPSENNQIKNFSRECYFTPESKSLIDVLRDLKRTKSHIAIVVDEHGGTAGLVTMEDVLEEIVGEIQDEYDVEEADILEIDQGIYDVSGAINIGDFFEYFELDSKKILEDMQDFETLAGLITEMVKDLPEVGRTVRIGPLNAEVMQLDRKRIDRVRISRIFSEGEEFMDENPT